MAPREATIQISRPILFRPFSSVTTGDQSTKTPDFQFVVPRQGDEFILLSESKWPTLRFVYVFLGQQAAAQFEALALQLTTGPSTAPNPLLFVIQVDPSGKQSVCSGLNFKQAVTASSSPVFLDIDKFEFIAVEPDDLTQKLGNSYAVAAPIVLPLSALANLEQGKPQALPLLGTGMGIGVTGPVTETPSAPDWVFPVVDPLLIAENLTRKFYEAADDVLAVSQDFDRPAARNDDEKATREQGEILRLRKAIADNLVALKTAAPSQASTFSSSLRAGFPDSFLSDYQRSLDELKRAREIAAFELVAWLESDLFALADAFWARQQGSPNPDYEFYVKAVLGGTARLAESERGGQYLADLRNRVEQGSSPLANGVLHVTTEFMFRTTQASSAQATIAIKASTSVFATFGSFITLALAVRQRVVKGPNPTTSLIQDMQAFAQRLSFVFRSNVLTVELDNVPVEVTLPNAVKKTVVNVRTLEFGAKASVRAALTRVNLPLEHVLRVCAVLNFGIALAALRSALQENNDPRAQNMALADLVGAGLGGIDQVQLLPAAAAFRQRVAGKLNMGGVMLGNRLSSTLGLATAILSLISATLATADAMDKGDWDQALAHVSEGVGAILIGTGSTVIMLSGATGPFALWTIGIGTAVSTAGFIWSVFAADTELDQMLKFCAFGQQAGQAALKPPGWALCKQDFSEWDPNTRDGLLRQLQAFQQIFYSFDASGAAPVAPGPRASDGILRITPSSLRQNSSFLIAYTAVYSPLGSQAAAKTLKGRATLAVPTSAVAVFVDTGNNYETAGAVRVHKDGGSDALDIRLRLVSEFVDGNGNLLELSALTCDVQLQVPAANADDDDASNGGALLVPTTVAGPKFLNVPVVAVPDRKLNLRPVSTTNVT